MHKKVSQGYEVYPLVIPVNQVATIRIRPRFGHLAFPRLENIAVKVRANDGTGSPLNAENVPSAYDELQKFELLPDGTLAVTAHFYGEQKHRIILDLTEPGWRDCSKWSLREHDKLTFAVYSVKEDLQNLRAYRGDFHMHSCYSDGVEMPNYVAARNREFGMDFIALTDHHRYAPSVQAIEFWQQHPTGLKLFPGEEVHADQNNVHIINFGGNYSINDLIKQNLEQYHREVEALIPTLAPFPANLSPRDQFMVAASHWVFDHIREAGGIALFSHPYWETSSNVLNVDLVHEIFKRRKFDAVEMIAGFFPGDWYSNNSQIVQCYEEWEKYGRFPIVGVSDAHGTEQDSEEKSLANWYSTIVFAPDDEFASLAAAIRAGQCVAVQKVGQNGLPLIVGDFRLVRYAQFLWDSYFPLHDELCQVEGALMRDLIGSSIAGTGAGTALAALAGRVEAYRQACFNN